jgi:hypothetical protein
MIPISYILPIRTATAAPDPALARYLHWLSGHAEVIVVDGSDAAVFDAHAREWADARAGGVRHVPPAPELMTDMGKVGGVLTGIAHASQERVIVADDDVRYDEESLAAVAGALDTADVVRPQNFFAPLPWHAAWDSGRMLLNRVTGGDWPGTLGVRRSRLVATGGYDGRAMFENLELVRTVLAAGGRAVVLYDVFIPRRPSTTAHFWSQRVRQAYDELARPERLALQLAVLPLTIACVRQRRWRTLLGAVGALVMVAEAGRQRGGARRVFPARASLLAPAWVAERAVCAWLAVGARLLLGGVPYRGRILRHAATPLRALQARHRAVVLPPAQLPRLHRAPADRSV